MSKDKIYIKDQRYDLVVLRVDERDAFGRPTKVTVGYDDTLFDIQEGNEFVTAFVHGESVKAKTAGQG